jgi:predicted nucleic acid-binding protein
MTQLYVAQPPAAYRVRPPLVVDCSVLAALLFDEPQRDIAATQIAGLTLHAPMLLESELVSVALRKSRAGMADVAALGLKDYGALSIELHRVDLQAQFEVARRHGLSAYDAAYLCLAAGLRAPLATFDRRLGEAAAQHLGGLA